MARDICLDIIISLIKADKTEEKVLYGSECSIKGVHYLLGQVIRQYSIPNNNYYISEAAKKLWKNISDDNIWNYVYKDRFELKCNYKLPKYVGANKTPEEVEYNKGTKVEFRSIFHDEHIIPICKIIDQLEAIDIKDLNYEKVKGILDRIVICRVLKSEDRKLPSSPNKRFSTAEKNIENVYKPLGINPIPAFEDYSKSKVATIYSQSKLEV